MANIASEYSGDLFGKFYLDDQCIGSVPVFQPTTGHWSKAFSVEEKKKRYKWDAFERAMVHLQRSQQPLHRKVCWLRSSRRAITGFQTVHENFRNGSGWRAVMQKTRLEMTSYRSRWPISRKFEGRYRMWILKISRDQSGRIGESLEL